MSQPLNQQPIPASVANLKHLALTGVRLSHEHEVLGTGGSGIVYKAYHNGIPCAAKKVDHRLRRYMFTERNQQYFIQECLRHSQIEHKNIVKMLGVSYGMLAADDNHTDVNWHRKELFLVMELMKYTLPKLLLNDEEMFIPMYVKLSILQDVSAGLKYLHTCDPPLAHGGLVPENILLSADLVAKIGDFGDSKVITDAQLHHEVDIDVRMFGHLACSVITQKWQKTYPTAMGHRQLHSILIGTAIRRPAYYGAHSEIDYSAYIDDEITERPLRHLIQLCLQTNPPTSAIVLETITDIVKANYSNDTSIKNAYSMALKKGQAKLKDLQVQLVGAENTGKTCLISSFLDEKFVEGQAATEGADVEVCKISSKNWTRSSDCDKTNYLDNVFAQYFRGNAFKYLIIQNIVKPERRSSCESTTSSSVSPVSTGADGTSFTYNTAEDLEKQSLQSQSAESIQTPMQYDLIAVFWDFAGQVIFHNSHSAFISDNGVIIITFNASMKLTDKIVPREGFHQPPESHTMISSIHYWLQVVNSTCSVQENVLLVGTHIDKLHNDMNEARKIAKDTILPQLHEELKFKPYTCHLAGFRNLYKRYEKLTLRYALEKCCFFVSNKCRDKEIHRLRVTAIEVGTALQKKQPIYFLKIEQALMQQNEPVISKSQMLNLVTKNTFALGENSLEFKSTLKYFHDKRTILHFSEIESLKNIVILSPHWLAKLFSYVIAADSFEIGNDAEVNKASERLHKYGILHDCLLQHMLKKFQSEYPAVVQVTKQQVVDILLLFRLVARITKEAWFREEGFISLSDNSVPDNDDTFIVPCLVLQEDTKNIPNTDHERIIYFQFISGFVPVNLLNWLIADCICHNVKRNRPLLWMRYGKVGLQLGAHQKYYVSKCEEKQSIQLTITVVGNDSKSSKERKELIDDITQMMDDIMKLFMPTVSERATILFPCPLCPTLHITMNDVCSDNIIFCAKSSDAVVPPEFYCNLLPNYKQVPQQSPGASSSFGSTIMKQKPDMRLLNKIVIPRIKAMWDDVAYSMGHPLHYVEAIQIESHSLKRCCQKLFSDWLETSYHPTWRNLLMYIKDADLLAAAEEIEKKLQALDQESQQET